MDKERRSFLSFIGITLAALVWFFLRTGTRPDRIRYPCQKASLDLAVVGIPLMAGLIGVKGFGKRKRRRRIGFLVLGILVAMLVLVIVSNSFFSRLPYGDPGAEQGYAKNSALTITELHSDTPVSAVYLARGRDPADTLGSLLLLMAEKGLPIYKTKEKDGIVERNDTVLIKVNGEWQERGGTNTDLVKAFIQKIVDHPEGFSGEVVVVENGQWAIYLDSNRSNSENRNQSFAKVVEDFENQGYEVSLYDWTQIGGTAGDIVVIDADERKKDGYVDMPGGVSYPIFTTKFGSRISLKDGIWNGKGFDKSHLKFINMPVLKSHSLMGVTAAIKHYMGVLSTPLCNDGFDQHQGMIKDGLMGRMMAEVIYPDLNVIDANYIGVSSRGPASSYSSAYKADIVLAGTDPVALDYYAGKHILYPLTEFERHDPDSQNVNQASGSRGYPSNAFNQYLVSSKRELEKKGYRVTMNEKEIQVFVSNAGQ